MNDTETDPNNFRFDSISSLQSTTWNSRSPNDLLSQEADFAISELRQKIDMKPAGAQCLGCDLAQLVDGQIAIGNHQTDLLTIEFSLQEVEWQCKQAWIADVIKCLLSL